MTRDERRTAHLLLAPELAAGELRPEDLEGPELERAVEVKPIPSAFSRRLQRRALERGDLSWGRNALAPSLAARRALLGDAAAGPPRVLLRVDGFGHPAFGEVRALLREAGAPHLVTVPPDEHQREALIELRHEGVAFAQLGADGETELTSLRGRALGRALDDGRAVLRGMAIHAPVAVAPGDRYGERAWPELASRFDVVSGGPATVAGMGYHPPAQWRGDAVHLPAYPPLNGPAATVAGAVEELAAHGAAVWAPAVIRVADEARDLRGLARLAAVLGAGLGRPWDELEAAVELSRRAA